MKPFPPYSDSPEYTQRLKVALGAESGSLSLDSWTDAQLLSAETWCTEFYPTAADIFRAEWEKRGPTLREASGSFRRRLREGNHCPCCDRVGAIRRRTFGALQTISLVWLARQSTTNRKNCKIAPKGPIPVTKQEARDMGWVRWAKDTPPSIYRIQEINRLCMFKVAERGKWDGMLNIDSGRYWYRPTRLGYRFVSGEALIPKSIEIYNNEVVAVDDEQIDVRAALKEKFDLDRLLGAALTDTQKWESLVESYRRGGS